MDIFTLICYKILYDLIEKTENKLKTMFTNIEFNFLTLNCENVFIFVEKRKSFFLCGLGSCLLILKFG